jgi:hypothetical protein
MRWSRAILGSILLGFTTMIGCARSTPSSDDSALGANDTSSAVRSQPGDLQAEVARLERRLRDLAIPSGCDSAGQCKTAPIGERACGGPREYVLYCPLTSNEPELLAVVDSLKQAEMRHNQATGAVSTCEYRLPPNAAVVGGRCVVAGN